MLNYAVKTTVLYSNKKTQRFRSASPQTPTCYLIENSTVARREQTTPEHVIFIFHEDRSSANDSPNKIIKREDTCRAWVHEQKN